MNPSNLTNNMRIALTMPETRAAACSQLSDKMRERGHQHADVIKLVQDVYTEAGKPSPAAATVDAWLDEAE